MRNVLFPVAHRSVDAGGVAGEWIHPPSGEGSDGGGVLYLHGGGFVTGSPRTHRVVAGAIATHSRTPVLCLEYRLAPEHPYPAALEDALRGLEWLAGRVPGPVSVAGDSAGGGLGVAAILEARETGGPPVRGCVCLAPWVDLARPGDAEADGATRRHGTPSPEALGTWARWYLDGGDPRDPRASPLHADLRALPPTLVQVGTEDPLLGDATALTEAARARGAEVVLELWEGLGHGFHGLTPLVPEASRALRRAGAFLRSTVAD